jgi:hypothetical protein
LVNFQANQRHHASKLGNELFPNSKRNDPKRRHSSLIEHGLSITTAPSKCARAGNSQTPTEVSDPYNAP